MFKRSGASPERPADLSNRFGALLGGRGAAQRRLPVARRPFAGASLREDEDAFPFQLLECAVQGATIRHVAEDLADVVAVEGLGNLGERILDVVEKGPGLSPGRLRSCRRASEPGWSGRRRGSSRHHRRQDLDSLPARGSQTSCRARSWDR